LLQAEADSRTVWFRVLVRNAGFCLWRAGAVGEPGTVHLGVQLCRAGTVLNPNYCRSPLPADLEPGQSVTLALAVPRPADPDLSLRLDLVAEGVTWFDCPDCIIDLAAGTIGQAA
jgi:hypothetical protein